MNKTLSSSQDREVGKAQVQGSRSAQDQVDGDVGEEFKPMSAEEAAQWRQRQRPMSVYQPLMWQLVLGSLAVMVALVWFSDRTAIAKSTLYGVAAVWVPAWVFVRALKRQQRRARHSMEA